MTKPNILQVGSYPDWDQVPLEAAFQVHRYFEAQDKAAFLADVGPRIQAIATRGELGANAAMIAACPQLKLISVYGVGYDAVDLAACRERGIIVTNTPDVLTEDVADLALGMMLAQTRQMVAAEAWARSGDWAAKGGFALQRRVWGRKAAVMGLGRIGMAVARRLQGFGMQIAYSATAPKPEAEAQGWAFIPDPVALAEHADFLFITLLANAATRHIVSAQVLRALGPDGRLINVSRAANIDEEALLTALESGSIAGAALDVFEGEPRLNPRFTALDNVLLQPHHGSGTFETRKGMGALLRANMTAHFAGLPLPSRVI